MAKWIRLAVAAAVLAAACALALGQDEPGPADHSLLWMTAALRFPALLVSLPAVLLLWSLGRIHPDPVSLAVADFAIFLAAMGVARRVLERRRQEQPREVPGRRAFLLGAGAAGLAALGCGYSATRDFSVTRHPLVLPGLPPELQGLRIVLISDLHRGPWNSMDLLAGAVRRVNDLGPDLVLVPGDFVYVSSQYFEEAAEVLAGLRARVGVLGTLGNHDHWEGADRARAALPRSGLRLLDDDRLYLRPDRTLDDRPPARGLCLAGVGDLWEGRPDLAAALRDAPPGMPRILLSHNPDFAEEPQARNPDLRVDVMFSGHTHGGQVQIPLLGAPFTQSRYGNRYLQGWARGPRWPVYVTRGLGTTLVPVRLGAPPEITVFDLAGRGRASAILGA